MNHSRFYINSETNYSKSSENRNRNEFALKYQLGINNQAIETVLVYGSVFTFGRSDENDICSGLEIAAISRIQCFIFVIDDSLLVMDGWSFLGTQTIKVNDSMQKLQSSMPNKRVLLRFNKSDCIHLRFGEKHSKLSIDLILNPRECVICKKNARIIANRCGHKVLCRDCFFDLLSQPKAQCPICKVSLKHKSYVFNMNRTATSNDCRKCVNV